MKKWMSLLLFMVLACAGNAHGKIVAKAVPYTHNNVELEGYLAYDDSVSGKRPAILVVHEWWGLNEYARQRAKRLAAMGYVAFALDMYGKGKSTTHPEQAREWASQIRQNLDLWRDRALTGLEVLKKQELTDKTRMAAIGYCFGGATVQQLAYASADLTGIVSFHGPLIPPPGNPSGPVHAKVLICHGAADPFVKEDQIPLYFSAMNASGIDWQVLVLGGAKHSFTNPDADKAGMDALRYDKTADRRSWEVMKSFFDELFNSY